MLPITVTNDEESGLCPVRNILASVNGKWQPLILLSLEEGVLRFSAIKRVVGDISQRVLTENLRSLERDGCIIRIIKPGPPVEVTYEQTSLGTNLVEFYKSLVLRASRNFDTVITSRAKYDARSN